MEEVRVYTLDGSVTSYAIGSNASAPGLGGYRVSVFEVIGIEVSGSRVVKALAQAYTDPGPGALMIPFRFERGRMAEVQKWHGDHARMVFDTLVDYARRGFPEPAPGGDTEFMLAKNGLPEPEAEEKCMEIVANALRRDGHGALADSLTKFFRFKTKYLGVGAM